MFRDQSKTTTSRDIMVSKKSLFSGSANQMGECADRERIKSGQRYQACSSMTQTSIKVLKIGDTCRHSLKPMIIIQFIDTNNDYRSYSTVNICKTLDTTMHAKHNHVRVVSYRRNYHYIRKGIDITERKH